jgi:hypothetical protein
MVVVVTVVSHPLIHVGHDEGDVTTKVGVTGHALSEGGTLTVDVEMMIHKTCGGQVSSDGHFSLYFIRKCQTKRGKVFVRVLPVLVYGLVSVYV